MPPQPDQRRVDPWAGREHRPVDARAAAAPRRRAGRARSAPRRCASRAPRAAGRRSRAGPSASTTSSPGSSAIVRRISGVAIEYGRLATIRFGGGSSGASSTRIASPKWSSTFGVLGGDRLQPGRAGARSSSTTCTPATSGASCGGQRPLAAADLEHHVAGPDPGLAHDRLEQVRVREEVLAEPSHGHARAGSPAEDAGGVRLHRRLELGVGDPAHLGERPRRSRPRSRARSAARGPAAARGTGASVSTSSRSSGTSARRLAQRLGLRVGEVAGERAVPAPLGRLEGALRRGREAVQDHRRPRSPRRAGSRTSPRAPRRRWSRRRRGRGSRAASRLGGRSRSGRGRRGAEPRAGRGRGSSRAPSRRRQPPAGAGRAPRSAPPPRRRSPRPRSGGGRPRRTRPRAPRPRRSPRSLAASSMPTVSIRRTPTRAASATRTRVVGLAEPEVAVGVDHSGTGFGGPGPTSSGPPASGAP